MFTSTFDNLAAGNGSHPRRHSAGRIFSTFLVWLVVSIVAFGSVLTIGACKAKDVKDRIEQIEPKVEVTVKTLERVITLLEDADRSADTGLGINTPAVWQQVRTILPPEWGAKIDEAIAKGVEVRDFLRATAISLYDGAKSLQTQMTQLKQDLASAKDDDDATWAVIASVVGGVGTILGIPGIGAILNIGRRQGAAAVASIADIDGEVVNTISQIHPKLAQTVNEFRDWHLDQPKA